MSKSGCEVVRQHLSKYNDWDVDLMLAISKAETMLHDCNKHDKGDESLTFKQNGRTYGYSLGPLQVRILPGREKCDTYDIKTTVECAHQIWLGQGYNAWTVYQTGKYLKYL